LLTEMADAAGRIHRAFDFGGWFPAIRVDATADDADRVYAVVAEQLRHRKVAIAG
jgi:hypothetical protein